ncbi:DUF2252 domain-containing protein [Nakamurella flava]|uniref:DUF2252 domain-containing protein n=1 Tax=Nakamurella flava TaxID=2576308 RepID=A0A4U6QK15_9ACTN|nr:DUF2252 domain-containing protein [Nakamurella flava]TKV60837.1 DUF2252 domain-containing protein [Nakamurella flava]
MTQAAPHDHLGVAFAPEHVGPGRADRRLVGRKALGHWDPATRGHDPLQTILGQENVRLPGLLPLRHGRMASSPWAYYRGAAAVMAADLASTPHTEIMVQLCGDAHVLNFGLWNTPERTLAFDLRDFDETLPGPFEWDLKRFLASVPVLARENGVSQELAVQAVRSGYREYRGWMRRYATSTILQVWSDTVDAASLVHFLSGAEDSGLDQLIEKQARKRTSRGAARKLVMVSDGRRRISEDPPYRSHDLRQFAGTLQEAIDNYLHSVPAQLSSLLSRFDIVDVVQQVVGVGSVGMRIGLMLAEERASGDPLFFQIKEATASVYEPFLAPARQDNHGARVVQGQRLIQSAGDMFLGWTSVGVGDDRTDFYVRQFRDGKVIPRGDVIAPYLGQFAGACGRVLARAHARSGDAAAIADYLGTNDKAEEALVRFALAYADQTERDHAQLAAAAADGTISSTEGWPGKS